MTLPLPQLRIVFRAAFCVPFAVAGWLAYWLTEHQFALMMGGWFSCMTAWMLAANSIWQVSDALYMRLCGDRDPKFIKWRSIVAEMTEGDVPPNALALFNEGKNAKEVAKMVKMRKAA